MADPTARRECLRVLAASKRELPAEDPVAGREPDRAPIDEACSRPSAAKRLRHAIRALPGHERRLIDCCCATPTDLRGDQRELGIPKGSIGPTRGRCIARLRGDRHLVEVVPADQPGYDAAALASPARRAAVRGAS